MSVTAPPYLPRPLYVERILPYIGKNVIKVLVGQRRTGKSYLLFQIMDHIRKAMPRQKIVYINKELAEFSAINTSDDLLKYLSDEIKTNRKAAIFIDEVQDISGFEKALRSLAAMERFDIYCTGSNANLLSGELATYLSGRFVEIKVFGLSYVEFLKFHNLSDNNESLMSYARFGGLPYLKNLALKEYVVYDYLRNIYHTILYKDLISRYGIRNVHFLERLTEYLAENTGSLVSAKKISDFLKSQKINISPNIVLNYCSFLCSAFFVFRTPRNDLCGKKIFEIGEKYYFEDLGLRHTLTGFRQRDIGRILENIVYLHLRICGYDVTIGKLGDKEVDFVADRGTERMYVQVAYLIPDEKVHDREFGNLILIKDNYRKIVVSMDDAASGDFKGIEHVHIRKFLLTSY